MEQNNVDIPTFTYFNLRISTNLKYIALSISKLMSSTVDYTTLLNNFNTICQDTFNTLLKNMYTTNQLQISFNGADGSICIIDNITIDDINLWMTTDFRIVYKLINSQTKCSTLKPPIYADNICINIKYINSGSLIGNSEIPFMDWIYLDPTTLLNVCKQNYSVYYARFINYNFSSSNKDGRYSLPSLKFDAAQYYSSVVVACSLRLVNTTYKGPCMTCYISKDNGGEGKSLDIYFDNETGVFSYDDIHTLIKNNGIQANFPPNFPIEIQTIYNQMDQTPFSSNGVSPQLIWIGQTDLVNIPYIFWPAGSQLTANKSLTYKVNIPVITIFTNIGSKQKPVDGNLDRRYEPTTDRPLVRQTSDNSKEGYQNDQDNPVNTVKTVSIGDGSSTFNTGINYFSDGTTIYNNITTSSNITLYNTNTYKINKIIPPIDMTKSNRFITQTSVLPSDLIISDITNNYFVSSITDVLYNQTNLAHVTNSDNISDYTNNMSWFSSDNTYTKQNFISSELLIFVTDNTNVQLSDINNLSEDNYNMYFNPTYSGQDQQCNEAVAAACKLENSTDICACYPSFIDKNIYNVINNLSLANTDRWCISPLCSSNIAYKNNISKNNSYCTQICNSSLNIENKPYSSTNIDQTQIFSNCTNANTLINSQGTDCNNCKDDEFCSLSSSGERVCTKKSSCSLPCKDNYSCVIGKDNTQKCFPSSSTSQKCTSNSYCSSSEFCDPNFNICLPTVSNPLWIPILIVLGTFMICVIFFIVYKKIIMNESINWLSKTNIKFYILIFIITSISIIIYFTLVKKRENFDYSISDIIKKNIRNGCVNNKDCNKPNSSCLNNICSCLIGYNYPNCDSDNLNICNSICYLPNSFCGGIYFYITQLNNTLYAFSNKAVFKFLNGKWYETEYLSIRGLQNTNINGFNPFFSTPATFNVLPNKLCNTYSNKMIMYIPSDSSLLSGTGTSFLVSFSPQNTSPNFNKLNNPNNSDNPSNWTTLQSYTKTGFLSLYNKNNDINNIISIVLNDNLYIFGGYESNGDINNKIIQISLNDPSKIVEIVVSQKLSFLSFSTCLASLTNNNIIYIIGVNEKGNSPSIYSFDINNIKQNTVSLYLITQCPSDLIDEPITPNNGNVLIFNTIDESIYFIYNSSIKKISLPHSGIITTLFYDTISFYKDFTNQNIATDINNYIFPSPKVTNTDNVIISWGVSSVILNDFLFVISGDGSIVKISDYTSSAPKLVPCLPINFTGPPIYNKDIGLVTPVGFKWSSQLGGYYQTEPNDNIYTSCVSCSTYCNGGSDSATDSQCFPAVYNTQGCGTSTATGDPNAFGINYAWAGFTPADPTYNPKYCSQHEDDDQKCRMYAITNISDKTIKSQLTEIQKSYPIFFCSNNKNDKPFLNNKGDISIKNPNWVQSLSTTPNNTSYFIRKTLLNDSTGSGQDSTECNGIVDNTKNQYCKLPDY